MEEVPYLRWKPQGTANPFPLTTWPQLVTIRNRYVVCCGIWRGDMKRTVALRLASSTVPKELDPLPWTLYPASRISSSRLWCMCWWYSWRRALTLSPRLVLIACSVKARCHSSWDGFHAFGLSMMWPCHRRRDSGGLSELRKPRLFGWHGAQTGPIPPIPKPCLPYLMLSQWSW